MSRLSTAARAVLASAVVIGGLALFLAPLGAHGVAVVTGLGLVPIGLGMILRGPESSTVRRVLGAIIALLGIVGALWPAAGAPALPRLIGTAVLLHGLTQLLGAFGVVGTRGSSGSPGAHEPHATRVPPDRRVAQILTAVAGIAIALIAIAWPALTLTVFRLALGAWFVFLGVRGLLELIAVRASTKAEDSTTTNPAKKPRPKVARLRRWAGTARAGVALVASLTLATCSLFLLTPAALPEPDAFYTPPTTVPDGPGHLIRTEPLDAAVAEGTQEWRMLYTTTDASGTPTVSSGTFLAPQDRSGAPLPLLSIAHGTTGIADSCTPSLSDDPFNRGARAALVKMVTEHGWAAVMSDYTGLGTPGAHAYLGGGEEARNVLDAARAAQEFTAVSTSADTLVWGHSQGGQGALWAGQIAKEYAPDLHITGIAAFAPATDPYRLVQETKDNGPRKLLSAYLATSWNELYPDLGLDRHLTPGSAKPVQRVAGMCLNGRDALAAFKSGSQLPDQIFSDSAMAGRFGKKLKAQEPKGPFATPVLVAQGLTDTLVSPEQQNAWVKARCKAGAAIDYRTYPGLAHGQLVAEESPLTDQLVDWSLARKDGERAARGCGSAVSS